MEAGGQLENPTSRSWWGCWLAAPATGAGDVPEYHGGNGKHHRRDDRHVLAAQGGCNRCNVRSDRCNIHGSCFHGCSSFLGGSRGRVVGCPPGELSRF